MPEGLTPTTDDGVPPMTPPGGDYVSKDMFEERHKWTQKWLQDLTEGVGELRNEVRDQSKKIDLLLAIERKEQKSKEQIRKDIAGLIGKIVGGGGAGAGLLYIIQRIVGS